MVIRCINILRANQSDRSAILHQSKGENSIAVNLESCILFLRGLNYFLIFRDN